MIIVIIIIILHVITIIIIIMNTSFDEISVAAPPNGHWLPLYSSPSGHHNCHKDGDCDDSNADDDEDDDGGGNDDDDDDDDRDMNHIHDVVIDWGWIILGANIVGPPWKYPNKWKTDLGLFMYLHSLHWVCVSFSIFVAFTILAY